MLPIVPRFTPAVLRQCARHAATSTSLQQLRAFTSSPAFRQSSYVSGLPTQAPLWTNILRTSQQYSEKAVPQVSPDVYWTQQESAHVKQLDRPHNAYSGRSVPVIKGDVSSALTKLKGILTINAVRSTNIRDERHEKKGEKRNRLKSLRWRRRFAHEVRKKVQLVNEIRARGA